MENPCMEGGDLVRLNDAAIAGQRQEVERLCVWHEAKGGRRLRPSSYLQSQ